MYIYTEADFGWAFINPDFSCAILMKDIKMTTAYWGEEGTFIKTYGIFLTENTYVLRRSLAIYPDPGLPFASLQMSEIFPKNIRLVVIEGGHLSFTRVHFDPYLLTIGNQLFRTLFKADSNGTLAISEATVYATCALSSEQMIGYFGNLDLIRTMDSSTTQITRLSRDVAEWNMPGLMLTNVTFACCQPVDLSTASGKPTTVSPKSWSCSANYEELKLLYNHERFLSPSGCSYLKREECCDFVDGRSEFGTFICVPSKEGTPYYVSSVVGGALDRNRTSECEPLSFVQSANLQNPDTMMCPDFFPGDFDYLRTNSPPNPADKTDGQELQAELMVSLTALLILFVAASFTGVYLYQRRSHLNKQKLKNLKHELLRMSEQTGGVPHGSDGEKPATVVFNRRQLELKQVLEALNSPLTPSMLRDLANNNFTLLAEKVNDDKDKSEKEKDIPQAARNKVMRQIKNLHQHIKGPTAKVEAYKSEDNLERLGDVATVQVHGISTCVSNEVFGVKPDSDHIFNASYASNSEKTLKGNGDVTGSKKSGDLNGSNTDDAIHFSLDEQLKLAKARLDSKASISTSITRDPSLAQSYEPALHDTAESDARWAHERQKQMDFLKTNLPVEGDIIQGYRLLSIVGTGTNGRVYLAESEDKRKFVLKFPFTAHDTAVRESYFLTLFDHSNIVQLVQNVVHNSSLVMVLEHCQLGDLQMMLSMAKSAEKYFDESIIIDWLTDLAMALDYLHDQCIAHRDIKPANVFIGSDGSLRLGDFGTAKSMFNPSHTMVGTPLYMAPEVQGKSVYTMASDIWSAGALVYELCMLMPPYNCASMDELVKLKSSMETLTPIPVTRYSQELVDLVTSMIEVHPDKRPTAVQVINSSVVQPRLRLLEQETLETPLAKIVLE